MSLISKNLKTLREFNGFTQGYMAEQLGITLGSYHNKEMCKTEFTLNEAHNISEIFKMPIDDIFFKKLVFDMNTK